MYAKFIALVTVLALSCALSAKAEDVPLDSYTQGFTDYSVGINTSYSAEPIVSEPLVMGTETEDAGITSVDTHGSTGAMTGNGMGVGGVSYGVELGGNDYGTGPGYGNGSGITGGAGGTSGGGIGGTGSGGAGGGNSAAGHGGGGGR